VTTASDEHARDTIYRCLDGLNLPWLAPVGRLDKASEGLLLLSNDPAWAARLTNPLSQVRKTYHVQIDAIPTPQALLALRTGIRDDGEELRACDVRIIRTGARNAWLEFTLDEGRNRQIRRMLAALQYSVLRLIRIAIGGVELGSLPKGQARALTLEELARLAAGDP
jgi:23S rRNA pseudouridine2605 synthase